MKILVDKMPAKVDDCPWSYPIENPWNDYTTWFCQYSLSNGETCPMVKGGECHFLLLSLSRVTLIVSLMPSAPFLKFIQSILQI